jgi:hypothetical protein
MLFLLLLLPGGGGDFLSVNTRRPIGSSNRRERAAIFDSETVVGL